VFVDNQFYIYDFVWAISEAIDLISPVLHGHHKQVAYVAGNIAQEMGLSNDEIQDIILAAMIHDIGAFTLEEWGMLLLQEASGSDLEYHSTFGYLLLKDFEPLAHAAELIKYHHAEYDRTNKEIPTGSFIICLANEVSLLVNADVEVLKQVPQIYTHLYKRRETYHPDVLAAFENLVGKESFWIETSSLSLIRADMLSRVQLSKKYVDVKTFRDFARIAAHIIDFRSGFTATHSSGVAAVAMELAQLSGFSERECKMMEVAGFLHDLGKLAVPNEILEKKGPLTAVEYNAIRKHTYYTHVILSRLRGLEYVADWAAFHHERPDGNGYPFHIENEDFSKLSRIMAVADVVTALMEDRPYRNGMSRERAISILQEMANKDGLDKDVVALVKRNFLYINNVRKKAQYDAQKEYEAFRDSIRISVDIAS